MADTTHDIGPVLRLEAEAQGRPGQRTFYINAASDSELVVLQIEKEQLQALGIAIEQLLAQFDEPAGDGDMPVGFPSTFISVEMRATRLGLGFDESSDLFVVVAYRDETEENDPPDFVCRADREMMVTFGKQIEEVVAAGRPRCPLCSAPMGAEGHVCVRTNGHFSAAT